MTSPSSGGGTAAGGGQSSNPLLPNPDEVNQFHRYDDVDVDPVSHHHTLGIDPAQASPGDHTHDGRNSKQIGAGSVSGLTTVPGAVRGQDTRSVADTPATLETLHTARFTDDGMIMTGPEFKDAATIGLPFSGFAGVVTVTSWGDDSGGPMHQLAFGGNSKLYRRTGTRAGGWTAWLEVGSDVPAWHEFGAAGEPAYLNGHSSYNYGGLAGFTKTLDGLVSVQGLVTHAANSNPIVQLPAGYRPKINIIFTGYNSTGSFCEMRIDSNGNIYSTSAAAYVWLSIAFTFYAGN